MLEEEISEFTQMLQNALEDLVNTRPEDPVRYLAIALCRALPPTENIREEFPELAHLVLVDSPAHSFNFQALNPTQHLLDPEGLKRERRNSVCAEESFADDDSWVPPTHFKDHATTAKLTELLRKHALMAHLPIEQLLTVVVAMRPVVLEQGGTVTRQDEPGDECFFVQSGTLHCEIVGRGHVCDYVAGDSFGEVSIMYGNNRGATITVWTI